MKTMGVLGGLAILSVALGLHGLAAVPAGAPSSRLNVTSQPDGAEVVVDGVSRGTAPLSVRDLAPGAHRVRLRLPGYEDRDCIVTTGGEPVAECRGTLEEEKGLLLLKTVPEGCDVLLDGVSIGVSPRLVTNLATKDTHRLRLRKEGYLDQDIEVKFRGRTPLVREERLVLSSGTIDIASEPSGAEVTVNGIVRGVTPLRVSGIPKGRAVVKFRLDGYGEEVRDLAVNAGDEQNLPVVLKPLPGTLNLRSVPDGARFYLDGEARGKAPLALSGLAPGRYEVRAELEGYGTVTRTVEIGNGASASEEFRLSNVMGRLEVRTIPVGAQVVLDGRAQGVTRSSDAAAEASDAFPIENVPEGEHRLVVRMDGYAEVSRILRVENSKTSCEKVRLRRVFAPDVEIVTAIGTYRGMLKANTPDYVEIEVSLGITRSFRHDEIRKLDFIKAEP